MATRISAALSLLALLASTAFAQPAHFATDVDRIFAKWSSSTPGCAVGVAVGGKTVLSKAYGMADLEHDVANTPDTIFEAGSVSKQFTAMAVLLLAKDGRLSLDDAVRKYIPELPDYVPRAAGQMHASGLTIRHMLSHTSGLRDWGSVEGIAGWPRTTREYTHAHVLDIVSRQKSLNFPSGTDWSYSNTGFNLAAIIVERVSGQRFADFTREHLFAPLGMTRTSWRDDHTRIVKGRAIAYAETRGEYRTEMPFENVFGNGGLLTTVGDLLKWNENYVSPTVGTSAILGEQQRPMRTSSGKELDYALGLYVGAYRGVASVWHSGSTAGYRAHLSRYPDSNTSIAVLCNASSGDATRSNNRIADLILADKFTTAAPVESADPDPPTLTPGPSAAALSELAGEYWSDEAEVMLTARVDRGQLVLSRRPNATITLIPSAKDTFRGSIGTVTFRRDAGGHVNELSIAQERVWDLRFQRKDPSPNP
jgi:CubicO group peptidase (beta-lactamase class C family)